MTRIKYFFLIFMAVGLTLPAHGAKNNARKAKYSAIVMEATTGAILHTESSNTASHPASITKIMTLYLLFEALESRKVTLRTKLPISARAAIQPPCKLGLKAGGTITVKDALLGLVTKSANDASVAIAEYLGGSEDNFAKLMTKKARALGMARTTFKNAHGLHNPGQVTTAHDMAVLGREVFRRYPKYYTYFRTQAFWYNGQRHNNHNKLLAKVPGVDGIKTGFTNPSGFTLVASAQRDGRRLIGVVLGGQSGPSRDRRMIQLLDTAFQSGPRTSFENAPTLRNATLKEKSKTAQKARTHLAVSTPESDPLGDKIREVSQKKQAHVDPLGETIRAVSKELPDPVKAKIRTLEAKASLPKSRGTWSLQVGAFSRAADAQKAARTHLASLPGGYKAKITVAQTKQKRRHLYQARLTGLTQEQATFGAKILEKMGQQCLILRPRQESTLISAENTR